jgi:uncharacterized protein (UPF0305 family)
MADEAEIVFFGAKSQDDVDIVPIPSAFKIRRMDKTFSCPVDRQHAARGAHIGEVSSIKKL